VTDVFAHPWLSGLFADAEAQAIWSAGGDLSRMIAFEAAWSRALGTSGAVEVSVAEVAAKAIEDWQPDMALLRDGTAKDGLPVPALVRALKATAGDAADAVHAGATSQDVMDSALSLALVQTVDLLAGRVDALQTALANLSDRFGGAEITGRTRMQDALSIRAGTRIAAWSSPLPRHADRLSELRSRVAVIQIGGPVGDRRNIPEELVADVAHQLGLSPAPCWHSARDTVAEAGAVFAGIAGSCGKIGQDMALMAQDRTLALNGGGGSSAMPHKINPVRAELLVTLARFAVAQTAALTGALVHEQERSGAAWALEWMTIPQLAVATAKALATAAELCEDVAGIG